MIKWLQGKKLKYIQIESDIVPFITNKYHLIFYVGDKFKVVCYLFIVSFGPSTRNIEKLPELWKELRICIFMHDIFHATANG